MRRGGEIQARHKEEQKSRPSVERRLAHTDDTAGKTKCSSDAGGL